MNNFFLFDHAANLNHLGLLDFSAGNFYAHLVQSYPSINAATVAEINLGTGDNYSPVRLTGKIYNQQKLTFDDFHFSRGNFTSPVTGVVVCLQQGANPSNGDLPIAYSALTNRLGDVYSLPPGDHGIDVNLPNGGLIEFEFLQGYASGMWAGATNYPNDIFTLIGTRNNTQAFISPAISDPDLNQVYELIVHNSNFNTIETNAIGDKSETTFSGTGNTYTNLILDFWGKQGDKKKYIRPGTLYFQANTNPLNSTITVYGSNDAGLLNSGNPIANSYWTTLGISSFSKIAMSGNLVVPFTQRTPQISLSATEYWRFLRFSITGGVNLGEIGFYDSSILSSAENFQFQID